MVRHTTATRRSLATLHRLCNNLPAVVFSPCLMFPRLSQTYKGTIPVFHSSLHIILPDHYRARTFRGDPLSGWSYTEKKNNNKATADKIETTFALYRVC